jgi:thiamine biosynthesis lipoprotein
MGTTVEILAPTRLLNRALTMTENLFRTWEGVLSRFRPDSELQRLNRQAGRDVPVSDLLWTVAYRARDAAQATEGWFDFTLGHRLQAMGYNESWSRLEKESPDSVLLPPLINRGWERVQMDPVHRTIRVPVGVQLDFGGIAKGMAVDKAVEVLSQEGITPVLVNAGGDLAVAEVPHSGAWPVAVGEEMNPVVALHYGALATSGTSRRRWRRAGVTYHHLLDPRTGYPSRTRVVRATVWAPTATQADVLAKVALLQGWRAGAAFLETRGSIGELEHEDGRIQVIGRWPERSRP